METNIILLIMSLFVILAFNIFYLLNRIKKQTQRAKQEFEDCLEKKIQLFLELIEEARKYAKLSQKIESNIKEVVEGIKKKKGFKDKKSLSKKISSVADSVFESISKHSEKISKLKEDLKEIEIGMESFKNLWSSFFKKKEKQEIFEEKRVKVKIKKKNK
ncbi:MAG: hypothetical protein MCSN_6130 [Candidatus Microsyncoccus archaeolyticus]|nr:MAG: hypothetical protein MCSN_6130 [Candidatus Parcubacteria bacterium]